MVQYPGANGRAIYSEKLEVGYRYYDAQGVTPEWPFGFGLSYTTFRLGNLEVVPGRASSATVRFGATPSLGAAMSSRRAWSRVRRC